MRFEATVDLSYRSYFGPGGIDLAPALDRGVLARVEKRDQLDLHTLAASHRFQQASRLQLAEQGVSTIAGDVITTWVEGAIEHRPSDWDTLKWITRATSVNDLTDKSAIRRLVYDRRVATSSHAADGRNPFCAI